jgi:exonuclease VII small subunit
MTGLNSVGSSSEKFETSVEDLPSTFEHIESEVEALDEVIAGMATSVPFWLLATQL